MLDFRFSKEQFDFRNTFAGMLESEVSASSIRMRWETATGFDDALWQHLVEMGLTSMLSCELSGGLDLSPIDFVLLAQECGRVALPEPLVESTLVSSVLLNDLYKATDSNLCFDWLMRINEGTGLLLTGHRINPYMNFYDRADAFLLPWNDEVHLVEGRVVDKIKKTSIDPSRRLAELKWQPTSTSKIVEGELGGRLWRSCLNRGAFGIAAQLLGLSESILEQAVVYSKERQQFGRAIGSNQAVKHLLADCAIKIEFARAVVYRAAHAVAYAPEEADLVVSHAKVITGEAALLCARNGMQVFGAMGYTWECDLQIWIKRVWALEKTWGDSAFHKSRLREKLMDPSVKMGPGHTFIGDNP